MTRAAGELLATAAQREAIEAPLGAVLVLAGPGAGKTFCLIERIRHLIERCGFAASRICAVTFTNKAAEEIAERLQGTLGTRADGIKGGTLHALCAEILREHGEPIGVRRAFGIADEEYQLEVLKRLRVWKEQRRRSLLRRFALYRAGGGEPLTPEERSVFHDYSLKLEQRNLLDFDDLVLRTVELFESSPEIARQVAGRWDYLLVDEFQDLTPKQYAVVRRLAAGHRNLFGVGDDEQSVYSWTGADRRMLVRFANDFELVRRVTLEENWRTARQIFEPARRLLERNAPLFEKTLRAGRESAHPVTALEFPDDESEARWVLSDLLADRSASALDWREYAVLYRRHRIGQLIEGALIGAGIPCRLARGRALPDDPVVGYLVAALRVIADPRDPLRREAFLRLVLPRPIWEDVERQARRERRPLLPFVRVLATRLGREDPTGAKLYRADDAHRNLPALGSRHRTLAGLVGEILSQRVGEFRTLLERYHLELSDPAADPGIVALARELERARHGRRRVWLPRLGGLEIALSGMLFACGITTCRYRDGAEQPGPEDFVLSPDAGGAAGLALGLFKALQQVHAGHSRNTFADFTAVDLETTDQGTDCEILELAAVRVRGGEPVAEYRQLVRPPPGHPIAAEAQRIHGITEAMVREQPALDEIWPAFRSFCGDDTLVAHNGNSFDFKILNRALARLEPGAPRPFTTFDSLPLARELLPGSRKLQDLAHGFGVPLEHAHRALDDARALVQVFNRLQAEQLARARRTALAGQLDYLGLALALSDPDTLTSEAELLRGLTRNYALGRFSGCLEHYRLERNAPGAAEALTLEEVINRLGGPKRLAAVRRRKSAFDRYPEAMARLRRLLDSLAGTGLAEQLQEFLARIALSRSDVDTGEHDPGLSDRVRVLTLHATKGLEFSRVYVLGVEDGQLLLSPDGREPPLDELEEARRLLYVGMTRAKDRLVLTRAERRHDLPTGGHRFLTEMGLPLVSP